MDLAMGKRSVECSESVGVTWARRGMVCCLTTRQVDECSGFIRLIDLLPFGVAMFKNIDFSKIDFLNSENELCS